MQQKRFALGIELCYVAALRGKTMSLKSPTNLPTVVMFGRQVEQTDTCAWRG